MFDKDNRIKIYKLCSFHKVNQIEAKVDESIEDTKDMYVILKG